MPSQHFIHTQIREARKWVETQLRNALKRLKTLKIQEKAVSLKCNIVHFNAKILSVNRKVFSILSLMKLPVMTVIKNTQRSAKFRNVDKSNAASKETDKMAKNIYICVITMTVRL